MMVPSPFSSNKVSSVLESNLIVTDSEETNGETNGETKGETNSLLTHQTNDANALPQQHDDVLPLTSERITQPVQGNISYAQPFTIQKALTLSFLESELMYHLQGYNLYQESRTSKY